MRVSHFALSRTAQPLLTPTLESKLDKRQDPKDKSVQPHQQTPDANLGTSYRGQ